ncbi:MAG: biotin transporter BioY [Bacteroidia bacterium]|nr:biotin transporter BioY [Bacteroidia bacterium]
MLIDQLPPITHDRFWDAPIKVLLATLLICLVAPIEIMPGKAVPVTLQSLVILVTAMLLGAKKGFFSVVLYLIMGFVGLPVFAEGGHGLDRLWGASGGFLVAFPLAAWVVGMMATGAWGQKWWNIILTLLTGHVIILIVGFGWYGFQQGFEGIMPILLPLLPGMYIKTLVGAGIVIAVNALMLMIITNGNEDS